MSNYYNNNNRGIYGNQNNFYGQGGQNSYLNNNNYNRQQGNYQNNYNCQQGNCNYNQNFNNNYQQQNYNNQNQQNNNGPRPFISAYMGRILISSDTLENFGRNLKTCKWTNNQNYLQAKNINVKIKMNLQGQLQSDINIPKNRFNNYNLNSNFNMNNFINFIKEVNNNNNETKKQIENEKNNFMRQNFPYEKLDLKREDLYIKIGQNRKDVIKNDSSLYGKVEKLLPLIKPIEIPKDSGIKESNMGAPAGPSFISGNNDGKIFTNTPGC